MADAGVTLDLEQGTGRGRSRTVVGAVRRRVGVDTVALGIVLVPLVVAAGALVFGVGGRYLSTSDLALEELAVRDVGRHPVLVGLHSRGNWSHPGPLLNYLLVPFYWLTGGRSIGLDIGTLAINGASIAGMALIARRHGGRALLLCTLVGSALMMRTSGADFLHDPWVCYVTTLPFGLLVMLSWSLVCGERRALPWAVFVASFLAQTHVGFMALALPVLVWGAAWLLVPGWRSGDPQRRRDLRRTGLVSSAVLLVAWFPLLLDSWFNSPSNTGNVWRWFGDEEEFDVGVHTLGDGWRVLTGQFHLPPEWLTTKLHLAFPFGESALLYEHDIPWLLLPVALAVGVMWRRSRRPSAVPSPEPNGEHAVAEAGDGSEAREAARRDGQAGGPGATTAAQEARSGLWLAATLGLVLVLGIVAVARTVGPVFDYRLRWTWTLAMLASALTVWVGWVALRERWPDSERRWLVPGALAVLVVVTGVNVVTAATTGTPYEGDSEIVGSLTEQVAETVDPDGGQVVIEAPFQMGMWWSRGLVLHLERRGVEVRVPEYQAVQYEFGHQHRRYDGGHVQAWLHVVRDQAIPGMEATPDMELVARWEADEPTGIMGASEVAVYRERDPLDEDDESGESDG